MMKSEHLQLACKVVMWINVSFALLAIALGIYKYTQGTIDSLAMVFIPFYLIIFGIILILAEFQLPFFIKYILFLANYLGRGIYNLFLSTIVINDITTSFSSLQGNSTTAEVITYIVVAILALIGVFYILLFVFRVDDKPNPKGLDYQHLTGAQIIKLKKRSFTQYKAWVKEELNKLEKPSQHSEDQITLQTQA